MNYFRELLTSLIGERIKLRWVTTGMGEWTGTLGEVRGDYVTLETPGRTIYAPIVHILNIEKA